MAPSSFTSEVDPLRISEVEPRERPLQGEHEQLARENIVLGSNARVSWPTASTEGELRKYDRQMTRSAILLGILGCGAARDPQQVTQDAPPADARPDAAGIDAGTAVSVPCDKTWTAVYRAADNTRSEYTTAYSLFEDIGPFDDFTVETCGYGPIPVTGCPSGYTCTETGAKPTGANCSFAHRTGTFYGGKLFVQCATTTRTFNAQGGMISEITYGYAEMRLHQQ